MPDQTEWVTLYNPSQQAHHRVPDHAAVIADFRDRGWETPDETAARVEAEAVELRGKELDEALASEDLSKGGTVAEKQARLAEKRAESANTTTEENEGEQV